MTTAMLCIACALVGTYVGVICTSLVILPRLNSAEEAIDLLLDELDEAEIANDLLMAERNGRQRHRIGSEQ